VTEGELSVEGNPGRLGVYVLTMTLQQSLL